MSRLTRLAAGMPCQIRIPGICNGDAATVVAAHYRSVTLGAGMGIKPPDWIVSHACSSCHDAADFRVKTNFTRTEIRLMFAEGVLRTLLALERRGHIAFSRPGE